MHGRERLSRFTLGHRMARMSAGRISVVLVAVALVGVAPVGGAGRAEAGTIVVESYGGERPADADALLRPVLAELSGRGFAAGAALSKQIEERLSAQATILDGEQVAEAQRFIKSGQDNFLGGDFALAVKDLTHGLGLFESAPATLARDPDLLDHRFRGLVYLSLAYKRQGKQTEATRTMAELIRSYPNRQISRTEFSPEVRDLHRKIQDELDQQGLGSLKIAIDDQRTSVFLNERYVGGGNVTETKLRAGRYRVFLQQGKLAGRVHYVQVGPGTESNLSASWQIDSVLQTPAAGVRLAFETEAARNGAEGAELLRLARAVDATGVVVVGIREIEGRRSIVGSYLSIDSSKPVRVAGLAVDPVAPSEAKLRALGRFLAGDEKAADDFDNIAAGASISGGPTGPGPTGPRDGGGRYKTLKWVTLVGGLALIGGGVGLIALHEPEIADGERNPDARNTRPIGIGVAAVGGALALSSVYFFIKAGGSSKESRGTALVPTTGGAILSFSGTF